ncbi:NADP-dependent oxidoreductase [Radicibacter daui]|uniref:NADP-dependent oxidoreductase n=1 Tax=Radicibacter daui TaxID=3064829 RepID=UPI004046A786
MTMALQLADYETPARLNDITVPAPQAGEVQVRVHAAALNPLDIKLWRGWLKEWFPLSFPYTIGSDFSGTIAAIGLEVTGWTVGDKVIGRADPVAGGAMAGLVTLPASFIAPAPASLDLTEAAGLPTALPTAWQALHEVGKVKAGQKLLIHAGAGGIGSWAIQLARLAGADVTATASGDGVEIARKLGAHQVIDYRQEDFTRLSGFNTVLDTVGGETQQKSLGVLRPGGLLVAIAHPADEAVAKAAGVETAFVFHQNDGARLARLVQLFEEQKLTALTDSRFALADFAAALERQASGRARGKVIIEID